MKKSVFLSGVKSLYKKEEVDVADHLKTVDGEDIDDELAIKILKDLDAEKVTVLKADATTRFDNGVKKGQKETAIKFEKKLKAVFNVDDDTLEGDDLIDHIEAHLPEAGEAGKGTIDLKTLTEDELAKIPAFVKKQKEFQTELKKKDAEKEQAIKAEQDKQSYSTILSEASEKALSLLDGKKPILPADAAKASIMKKKLLIDELANQKYIKGDNGELIPVDAEGKQMLDKQGNPLDFDDLVNGIIDNNFEFNIVDSRSSPGSKNKPAGKEKDDVVYKGAVPKNNKEYFELLTDESMDTEQKALLMEKFGEQFRE